MEKWKIIIAVVGLVASIITILVFFTGKQSIYEVIANDNNSSFSLREVENSANYLPDGIYIQPCALRKFPWFLQLVFNVITPIVGGDSDVIYTVKNNIKTVFLTIDFVPTGRSYDNSQYKFSISVAPNKQRFIVNFHIFIHLANLDGSNHNKFDVDDGRIENIVFVSSNVLRSNFYLNSYKETISFAQFKLKEDGLYDIVLDDFNIPKQIIKK